MSHNKKQSLLHRRNKHNGAYDFDALVKAHPPLNTFIVESPLGEGQRSKTINFSFEIKFSEIFKISSSVNSLILFALGISNEEQIWFENLSPIP